MTGAKGARPSWRAASSWSRSALYRGCGLLAGQPGDDSGRPEPASTCVGEQAQGFGKRAEGRGYLPPHVLNPASLMLAGPHIAADHTGIGRVGAIVKGDGNVIAQPPVHRNVEGLLDIKPGQVTRSG